MYWSLFLCQSQVFCKDRLLVVKRLQLKEKVCGKARHRADCDCCFFSKTPLSYFYLLCCQPAYLYTSSIPWWLLSKKVGQRTFNICGPDFLPLGQTLICQSLGFQRVTLLGSICACGPVKGSKFCLWDHSAHLKRDAPYLFHSTWCPGSSWMLTGPSLAWCGSVMVLPLVSPQHGCVPCRWMLSDKLRPRLGDRAAQGCFLLAPCLGEEGGLVGWR